MSAETGLEFDPGSPDIDGTLAKLGTIDLTSVSQEPDEQAAHAVDAAVAGQGPDDGAGSTAAGVREDR